MSEKADSLRFLDHRDALSSRRDAEEPGSEGVTRLKRRTPAVPRRFALFLLVGQSNMAGRGTVAPQDRRPLDGIWSLNRSGHWEPAVDPLHWDNPKTAGTGLGRSFARLLRERNPRAKIGLIPCAFGGTSLQEWEPAGRLFGEAVSRAKRAKADGELCGILWHQGEADARRGESARSYAERWRGMMATMRHELDAADVPVVVGELGGFLHGSTDALFPFSREVNRQLASLASTEERIGVVESARLKHGGDELHFSAPALRALGRRYAAEFLRVHGRFEEWR